MEAANDVAVSVVIPARDAAATLGATLLALADQDIDAGFEVIVVDNGSTDETGTVAKDASRPVKLIRRRRGEGPGVARNEGAAAATGPVLAFTDADCIPTRAWLREGLKAMAGADLVQGAVLPNPDQTFMPFDHTVWVRERTGLFETANLFVARSAFESVGGFEDLAATGIDRPFGEDAWLGWRLERGGARFGFSEAALVHHEVFRRGPFAYLAERRRLSLFPQLAALIPELRREQLFLGLFLNRRSAAFDLALAGAALALKKRSAAPAIACLPYAGYLVRGAAGWRRMAPQVGAVHAASDAVGLAALLRGSLRARSPLI